MNKNGALIIVEDDEEDRELLLMALKELDIKNEILIFNNGVDAFEYLKNKSNDPFIIISDINMPKMNGVELRDKVQKEGSLRLKTIPFLFLTTGTAHSNVLTQYSNSVQGFFRKATSYEELKKTLNRIIDYWKECAEPLFYA